MFPFHRNRRLYFEIQATNAVNHVIPFIRDRFTVQPGMRVLEIGCGEGGVLRAFADLGCACVGVDRDSARMSLARQYLADEVGAGKVSLIAKDVLFVDPRRDFGGRFDIVVLKDVIEHIQDPHYLIKWLRSCLLPNGVMFVGFPPWQMPFGGHQQICMGRWMSRLPWYHLLPGYIYQMILKRNGEPVDELMEIRATGISIERFERICGQAALTVIHRAHYLVNPIYELKFGWKARKQWAVISALPYVRDFITTGVYYLLASADRGPRFNG
jgi:cyclopropane fatty-acyl-phospholipid synthase-like methyltransferase